MRPSYGPSYTHAFSFQYATGRRGPARRGLCIWQLFLIETELAAARPHQQRVELPSDLRHPLLNFGAEFDRRSELVGAHALHQLSSARD